MKEMTPETQGTPTTFPRNIFFKCISKYVPMLDKCLKFLRTMNRLLFREMSIQISLRTMLSGFSGVSSVPTGK
jgi:hypothetical protein